MSKPINVEPAICVQLDIFPGEVYLETTDNPPFGSEYRVIVTDSYLYAIEDTIDGPQPTIKEEFSTFDGSAKEGYTVVTPNGTYLLRRAMNCGCGSRLRGIHPFAGVPFDPNYSKSKET